MNTTELLASVHTGSNPADAIAALHTLQDHIHEQPEADINAALQIVQSKLIELKGTADANVYRQLQNLLLRIEDFQRTDIEKIKESFTALSEKAKVSLAPSMEKLTKFSKETFARFTKK